MRILTYPRAVLTGDNVNVIGAGNSHMFGEGSTSGMAWFSQLAAKFPGITFTNVGIAGQRIQSMIDNRVTQIDNRLVSGKLNVIFAQEWGNEMANNGRDANAALVKWEQWCGAVSTAAENAGKRVYIITVGLHPTGAGATPADTLARINSVKLANTLMRANWSKWCDQFVDLGAHEPFQGLFDGSDYTVPAFAATGMYTRSDNGVNDRVHLGNPGHTHLANINSAAFLRVRRTN
jgi:hypothetical protein